MSLLDRLRPTADDDGDDEIIVSDDGIEDDGGQDTVGQNPTGRPRRSSAGTRRRKDNQVFGGTRWAR
mgnify:FL=1